MFDIGFSELVVIGVVALIVIGPERLPRVARTAGHLYGRLQRYVSTVKSDISREVQLDEMKKAGQQLRDSMQNAAGSLQQQTTAVDDYLKNEIELARAAVAPPTIAEPAPQQVLPLDEPEPPAASPRA